MSTIQRRTLLFAGLTALLLTTPVFPLAPRLLDRAVQGENVGIFTVAAGISAVVFALIAIAFFARPVRHSQLTFLQASLMCGVYFIAFVAGFWLMPLFANPVIACAFGIILGVGLDGIFVAWGASVATLAARIHSFGSILAMLCLATACAVLANMALVLADHTVVLAVLVVACAISAFVPPILLKTPAHTEMLIGEDKATFAELIAMIFGTEEYASAEGQPENTERTSHTHAPFFVLQALLPFSIFVLYAASQLVSHSIEGHHELVTWGVLAGPVLAALPLVARTDSSRIAMALRATLPLFGIVVLGAALLVPDAREASILALGSQALCYAYGITFFALAGYFAIARKPSALAIFAALGSIVLALVMMLPHFTFPASSHTATPLFVATLVAVLCLLAASASFSAWNSAFALARVAQESGESPAADATTLGAKVRAACDALADEFALSPREREILYYLGRGYGPRYLAGILPIKENTIRSHVRNIYAKTDVHTQADLLMLIDSYARH